MQHIKIILFMLTMVFVPLLGGCGQKGVLYLPPPGQQPSHFNHHQQTP